LFGVLELVLGMILVCWGSCWAALFCSEAYGSCRAGFFPSTRFSLAKDSRSLKKNECRENKPRGVNKKLASLGKEHIRF
jgi:hypothetical protein